MFLSKVIWLVKRTAVYFCAFKREIEELKKGKRKFKKMFIVSLFVISKNLNVQRRQEYTVG